MKVKIFVSAYACEPGLGSEIGVGWHWVIEMSKYFDLWVLTRESNRHAIELWVGEHPEYTDIRFIYFDLPERIRFWKKGLRGVRTYYHLWQLGSEKLIKRTMQENDIEIFHHLTYGNFLWSVSSYGQKQFFVWGPGSAGNIVPKEFSKKYCFKGRVKECLQRFLRRTLKYNLSFIKRCRNSALILCKTADTYACIPAGELKKAVLFTDVAVETENIPVYEDMNGGQPGALKFLGIGSLDGWRGFDVLIEAFGRALEVYPDMKLEILGRGCERKNLESLINHLHLNDRVILTGQVSPDVYHRKMREADVIINPCLREGGVTVAFDSMSVGKPLLCIDTGGYTRYFNNDHAVIIPLSSRQETIGNLKNGIVKLTDAETRKVMGKNAEEAAGQYSWEQKGHSIYETISRAYKEWKRK